MSEDDSTVDDNDSIKRRLDKEFGADYQPLTEPESYYPTRLEYFAGKALQGFVTGRSEKDLRTAAKKALVLAREMEDAIDAAVE